MYVENKILSKLYKDKNAIKFFREKGITHELFYDVEIKKCVKYILKFYKKYKEIPSKDMVLNKFSVEFEKCKDPIEYYIDKLIEHHIENKQKTLLLSVASNISDNPLETIEYLRTEISKIDFFSEKRNKILDMGITSGERAKEYFERKQCAGITGLNTPWFELTDLIGGIHSNDLFSIAALTAIGKTWLLCLFAQKLREQKINTLFATQEMGVKEIAKRADAIEFKLNYDNFCRGNLAKSQEQKFLSEMLKRKKDKKYKDYYKIAESNTLLDLEVEIKEHSIECLIVDGGYLLNEGGGKNITQDITIISGKLKNFAQKHHIPVIVTWQFAKSSEQANTPSLSHFNWSFAIAQYSSVVIGLQAKENMLQEKKRKLIVMKNREGLLDEWVINYNFEEMDFSIDEEYTKNECHPEQNQDDDVEY